MSDSQSKSMFDPFYFISEVSKEVVHQVTGHDFDENKREKSPQEICQEAYGDAIGSAIAQQAEIDKELESESMWYNDNSDSDDSGMDSFFD